MQEEIGHVRELISENQKALSCIVRVLTQIQDHIRLLNDNLQQWLNWQQRPLQGAGQAPKLIVEHQTRERGGSTDARGGKGSMKHMPNVKVDEEHRSSTTIGSDHSEDENRLAPGLTRRLTERRPSKI